MIPTAPPPSAISNAVELTDTQQKMYDSVLTTISADSYVVPSDSPSALSDKEKFWLSRECILRYLRASKWDEATAIRRLNATLKWRREYGLYDAVTAEKVQPEGVTGKLVVFGYDVDRRPTIYLLPSRQNTEDPVSQIQFTVWNLERSIDLMGPGVESLVLLIDFADRGKNPSIGTARQFLNILQEHYPERLGRALVANVPFLVNAFFKIILPFVDPLTRQKIFFNPSPVTNGLFTAEQITKKTWGGNVDLQTWEHAKYWPELIRLTNEGSTKNWERWQALGAKVGISEWAYKGGNRESATTTTADPQAATATATSAEPAPAAST